MNLRKLIQYFLMILFLARTVSVSAMKQLEKKIVFGNNSLLTLQGNQKSIDSIEKEAAEKSKHREKQTSINIKNGNMRAQISADGILTIPLNKNQGYAQIKDSLDGLIHGILIDQNRVTTFDPWWNKIMLPIENQEEIIQLKPGNYLILGNFISDDSPSLKITFDKKLKLMSKKSQSESTDLFSYCLIKLKLISKKNQYVSTDDLLSRCLVSKEVSVATMTQSKKYRSIKNRGKVFLDESIEETNLWLNFIKCKTKEEREKYLEKFSIVQHAEFLVIIHKHGLIKEFGSTFFDDGMKLLEKKISKSLKLENKKDMLKCWPVNGEHISCSPKAYEIIGFACRNVKTHNKLISLRRDNTLVVCTTSNGVIQIEKLCSNHIPFLQNENTIENLTINDDECRIIYNDRREEIINLEKTTLTHCLKRIIAFINYFG